jgi:iron(III) transport system substrate-binding protein
MATRSPVLHILAVTAALAGASGPAFGEETPASIYAAAKKEAKLVHWGSPDPKTARALSEGFAARYPGIAVEIQKVQPAPAIERVITATNAGRADVDVLDSQLGYVQLLADRELIGPYPWGETFGIDPARVMYGGRAVVAWHLDTPLAYNTAMARPEELKSWAALLDPKWRGKVIIEARGFMFAVLALAWGEGKAFDYLKGLVANRPVLTKGGTSTIEALAGGQGAVAFGAYGGILDQYKEAGAPVDWLPLSPIATQVAVAMPLKDAPHPNAARLWVSFLATQQARDILYRNQGLDLVTGRDAGPLGARYRAAGLDIVTESPDAALMRRLVTEAGALIGGLR